MLPEAPPDPHITDRCAGDLLSQHLRIRKMDDTNHSLFILTHEWAHAMVWPLYKDRDPVHPGHFGIAWAEAYRAIFHENA
jgi:hypothetical protein